MKKQILLVLVGDSATVAICTGNPPDASTFGPATTVSSASPYSGGCRSACASKCNHSRDGEGIENSKVKDQQATLENENLAA